MEFVRFIDVIVRRWWLLPIFVLFGVSAAWYYTREQTPLYQSTVTLALNPAVPAQMIPYVDSGSTGYDGRSGVSQLAASYTEILRSRNFASLVAARLGIAAAPEQLMDAISTRLVKDTNFFRITVIWTHPGEAQRIANGLGEVFISENLRLQLASTDLPAREAELEQSLLYYRPRIEALRAERDSVESSDQPALQADEALSRLDARLASLETVYNNLLTQLQAMRNTGQAGLNTASIVDGATYPVGPSNARPLQTLQFAIASSLALALGLAFLLDYLDFAVRRPEDLEQLLGTAPLGLIGNIAPQSSGANGNGLDPKLVTARGLKTAGAEAFRTLRIGVQFAAVDRPVRRLLITSTLPGEGKSLVSANLAVAYAQSGRRVLLVDADLRRPSLHRLLGVSRRVGLTTLVVGNQDGEEPIVDGESPVHPTVVPNLWLLPAGPRPPNPSDVISSGSMARLVDELAEQFDLLIFDSPPLAPVSDALVLASLADSTLVVVCSGKARRDVLSKMVATLQKNGTRVLGTVMNRLAPSSVGYYYYYHHYYYQSHYYDTFDRRNGHGERRKRSEGAGGLKHWMRKVGLGKSGRH